MPAGCGREHHCWTNRSMLGPSSCPSLLSLYLHPGPSCSHHNSCPCNMQAKSLSHVWLFATLGTVAYQAPLSMGFSRQEYWRGCHALLQGSSLPRVQILISSVPCIGRQVLYYQRHLGSPTVAPPPPHPLPVIPRSLCTGRCMLSTLLQHGRNCSSPLRGPSLPSGDRSLRSGWWPWPGCRVAWKCPSLWSLPCEARGALGLQEKG